MSKPQYPGLDPSNVKTLDVLSKIQATILKAHGRKYGKLLFFIVGPDPGSVAATRRFLSTFEVTTASSQLNQIRAFKADESRQETVIKNVAISYEGFRRLAIPSSQIPRDVAFRDGMKFASSVRLRETNAATWQNEFRQNLHGCILVASSSMKALEAEVLKICHDLRSAIGPRGSIYSEECYLRSNPSGRVAEHFGFTDGISQPAVYPTMSVNMMAASWRV